MKVRRGFVSNSSSSSFVIKKEDVTEKQLNALLKYEEQEEYGDTWDITVDEDEGEIRGETFMDNDDMKDYMRKIGIMGKDPVIWEGD